MKHHTIKQHFDISSLQDFVLNERNIERILLNTTKITKTIVTKSPIKHKKPNANSTHFLCPKFTDTLFWCYYIISNGISAYEIIHGDGFKDSLELKIQLVYSVREHKDLLKVNKWKKNAIEDELVNQKYISVTTFMCICAINNFNIVHIDGKKMYTLLSNDDIDSNLNIIEKTENGYSIFIGDNKEKHQKYLKSKEQFWEIDNLIKPLRGISSYKVKDLQRICKKLDINTHNDKNLPKKKSILYKQIQEYL